MHIRQSIGSFSCSSVSFMNDDFVLCWATGFKDVFSCVLEIELQSTRVHVYAIRKVLERRVAWLVFDSDGLGEAGADFLITRLVIIFLFLVKTRGAMLAEVCLRLEAD